MKHRALTSRALPSRSFTPPHGRVISIRDVFPALKVEPRVERALHCDPEGHAFAFAALIKAEDQPRRGRNAPMHHGIKAKRPMRAFEQRVRRLLVSEAGPPHQRAVGENP